MTVRLQVPGEWQPSNDYWLHQQEGEKMGIAIRVDKGICHLHHGCNKPIAILLHQNFKALI